MSDYQQKAGSINIFDNTKKRTKDTAPIMTGEMTLDLKELYDGGHVETIIVDGKETHIVKLQVSLWGKVGEKSGEKYLNGNVQPKKKKEANHEELPEFFTTGVPPVETGAQDAATTPTPIDNDLPF